MTMTELDLFLTQQRITGSKFPSQTVYGCWWNHRKIDLEWSLTPTSTQIYHLTKKNDKPKVSIRQFLFWSSVNRSIFTWGQNHLHSHFTSRVKKMVTLANTNSFGEYRWNIAISANSASSVGIQTLGGWNELLWHVRQRGSIMILYNCLSQIPLLAFFWDY